MDGEAKDFSGVGEFGDIGGIFVVRWFAKEGFGRDKELAL
jgi:hypothetical protein